MLLGRGSEEQEISSVAGAQLQSLAGEGPAHMQGTASLQSSWSPDTENSLLQNFCKTSLATEGTTSCFRFFAQDEGIKEYHVQGTAILPLNVNQGC